MKLPRFKSCIFAVFCVSFLFCMLVAIGYISVQHPEDSSILFHSAVDSPESNVHDSNIATPLTNTLITQPRLSSLLKSVRHDNFVRRKYYNASLINAANVEAVKNSCVETADGNSEDLPAPNYNVHVFYYPWYGNPTVDRRYLHWNHRILPHWKSEFAARYPTGRHSPPDDLGSSFYPRLGPYSSRDPAVIDDHMRQIRSSSAGEFTLDFVSQNQNIFTPTCAN